MSVKTTRRDFFSRSAIAGGTWLLSPCAREARGWGDDRTEGGLVARIGRQIVFPGRQGGTTWFHPRPCMVPAASHVNALMTLQSIGGSDLFGQVHWTASEDLGKTWTGPRSIPGLGRQTLGGGWEVGVCDVVPEYHRPSRTVLAVGHNVYYENQVLARPQRERWPVYVVRSEEGVWSEPRQLVWNDERGSQIYTCGCAQRVTLPDGRVLVPLSFGPQGRKHRSAATVTCSFDGRELLVRATSNELTNSAGRGLLEPTLAQLDGRFFLTIRAEDGHGYVTSSSDGMDWRPQLPWAWDDGEPLKMSTTQQRWLVHSDGLFLVYTRKAKHNVNVMRWRAPLFMAEVDRTRLRLIRSSERTVFPLIGDGIGDPNHVARMGNFHTVAATPDQSWVTVGETLPHDRWAGNTLLARIHWRRPNRLAPNT